MSKQPQPNPSIPNEGVREVTTKKCPFCAEEIRADAIKCRHCSEMLSDQGGRRSPPISATEGTAPAASGARDRSAVAAAKMIGLVIVVAAILGFLYMVWCVIKGEVSIPLD